MPKLTIEEAAELGLLGPEELAAVGFNPFRPRAGASWTPSLSVNTRPNFFRYPTLSFRSRNMPLRFGLGGLGQGLTLSPESPALGLAGVAAPVGRLNATGATYGALRSRGVAGGVAGTGAEGSVNFAQPQVMVLPDGRRLVRYPTGQTVILGPPGSSQRPIDAESHDGQEALAAMGVIGRGVGVAQQLARVFGGGGETHDVPGPTRDQHIPAEQVPAEGEPLVRPASLQMEGGVPLTPEEQAALAAYSPAPSEAALGELGINTDLTNFELAQPGTGALLRPPGIATIAPGKPLFLGAEPLEAFRESLPGPTVTGDVPQPGPWQGQPQFDILEGTGKPLYMGPEPGGDLSLSPAFYAPGGGTAADVLLDPEARRLYTLGLTPQQIQEMMPAPIAGRADTAPRGLGVGPSDVFGAEPAATQEGGAEGGIDFNLKNTLGLGQSLLNVGQAGITGDPAQLVGALLRSGMSVNQIAKIPAINQAGINAGLGGGLGLLNAIMSARAGNIPGAIGGGLSTIGAGANFLAGPLMLLDGGGFRIVIAVTIASYVLGVTTGIIVYSRLAWSR